VCAPTDEEAEWLAAPLRLWRLRLHSTGDPGPIPTPEEAAAYEYTARDQMQLQLMGNRLISGSPQTCRVAMEELAVRYGVDELVVVTIVHDHAHRVRSYELLAQVFDQAAFDQAVVSG
jgi:alkanesulfonate monooxygenase SsuD/methylene tetrahydromethanopterin reductase-like flavin-dependent oxidoreductase (luciferase family)